MSDASASPRTKVVFGLVLPGSTGELADRVEALAKWMSASTALELERKDAESYEALADAVRAGAVDVAWLPPIVYVRLGDAVEPLGSIERGGKRAYEAALVVRDDSRIKTIEALRGTRAGWVDPWSAAGFVLPRVKLALLGVDPRNLFRTETFHGSHRAAVRALIDGACDVAGTYARADDSGKVTAGSWSEVDGAKIRVLATFGAIPPDVIAVRSDLEPPRRQAAREALRKACASPEAAPLLEAVFNGTQLREDLSNSYDALESALKMASARGLFD